ncbi:MAG: hypothetical protein RBS08_09025, partial [Bdellovibrionales bacterium]|nr:hypothetical protein [Bdellovibrionales bacterium]
FKTCILLTGLVFVLSACAGNAPQEETATMRYQAISVMTPGVTGAHCLLQAGAHSYTTPANSSVTVRRTPDQMDVSCFKGSHMVGHTSVKPTVAPREADNRGRACESCQYPESVSVVLAIRASSVEKNNIRIMQ